MHVFAVAHEYSLKFSQIESGEPEPTVNVYGFTSSIALRSINPYNLFKQWIKEGIMDEVRIIVSLLVGYLVGSISFTRIVLKRIDPQSDLSGVKISIPGVDEPMEMTSVSANTAGLVKGPKVGATIGILDMLKVFLATLAIRLVFPDQPYYIFTALAGIIGHIWPIYYRFVGGRGISAIFGGLLAIDPLGALFTSLGGMVIAMLILRDFALIFPISLFLIIPWLWFTTYSPLFLFYGIAVNVLFVIAIIPELKEVIRTRKEKKSAGSMQEMMETNPMGRSMLSIARKMGWMK